MAKKKAQKPKKRGLPKNTAEWEALPDDEVMQHIFGKRAQESLKRQALGNDATPKKDYRLP